MVGRACKCPNMKNFRDHIGARPRAAPQEKSEVGLTKGRWERATVTSSPGSDQKVTRGSPTVRVSSVLPVQIASITRDPRAITINHQ